MAINRVEIKDFLVLKGNFIAEFCSGINVFIGANGTGKTTLLKILYAVCESISNAKKGTTVSVYPYFNINTEYGLEVIKTGITEVTVKFDDEAIITLGNLSPYEGKVIIGDPYKAVKPNDIVVTSSVFIPEKDLLSNSRGLPETTEHGKAEFTHTEIDIIKKARVLPSSPETQIYREICDIIGGEPEHDGQSFYMKRNDVNKPVPFSMEASGYRKLGLLALLIRNEMLKPGSVLFWDEPENSLNPELVPVLVDILLKLAQNEVQIFIATHDYNLARYFDVRKNKDIPVMFQNFSKSENGQISCVSSTEYVKIPNNLLETASADLFKAVVADALEVDEDE
jgi:energy-coupling factor transporter ATP-binding protein EcfA2